MKGHKALRLLLAVLLCGAGGGVGAAPAFGQEAVPVIVAEAKAERFVDRVEALGTLRANETVELTATVSESVTAIHFDDGQRVEAGDILVEMTKAEERALLAEALSTVAEARKQYDRARRLVERSAGSQAQLDERRRAYETARARLLAIESRLKDHLVIAPFSGVVGLRNISVGAFIEPGDVVTTLDDDSVMKLDFTVPAVHLATLAPGLPIEARTPAFPDRAFEGTVSAVDSRIDPATRSITARAILPNPERLLKPGMLMKVDLLKKARTAVVVPEAALIPNGKENHVLVVDRTADPPAARKRQVAAGSRRPGAVEILQGLAAGEFVVTHGTQRAREGQAVSILAVEEAGQTLESLLNVGQGREG